MTPPTLTSTAVRVQHEPASRPDPARRHPVRALTGLLVVAALVAGPAYLFAWLTVQRPADTRPQVTTQVDVAGRAPDRTLVAALRALPVDAHHPPAVITYHDIAETGAGYTVTPQAFADQMRLLQESGWHALRSEEFIGWLHGAALPPHSVLITFDDGARGVWRYADPILHRYGLRGVAFVISGFVGTHQPYYMTWPELRLMQASGRWDIQAHTYLGHVQVPVDGTGRTLPFLSTPQWLPALDRAETPAEFTQRVGADLRRCIADLTAHGFPRPALFAYPFSAVGDSVVGARVHGVVDGLFDAAFLDSPAGRPTTPAELLQRQFRRVDMLRSTTGTSLVTEVRNSLQRTVRPITGQAWRTDRWLSTGAVPVRLPATGDVTLTRARAGDRWGEIQLDPDHTGFWTGYRTTVVFTGLASDVAASVHTLLHSPDQVQVVVAGPRYDVFRTVGRASVLAARGRLERTSSTHSVETTVRTGSVEVRIDGTQVALLRTAPGSRGGIAVAGDPLRQPRPPAVRQVTVEPLRSPAG